MKKEFNPLLEENQPKVILYNISDKPLHVIANCYKMIEEEIPYKKLEDIPYSVVDQQVRNWESTLLQMPFELISLYFLIYNVPRHFSHQICEEKFISIKQQSGRFQSKVWENFKYILPKSIRESSKAVQIVKDYMAFVKEKYEHLFEIERNSKVKACSVDFFNYYNKLKPFQQEMRTLEKLMFNEPIATLEEKSTKFFESFTKKLAQDWVLLEKTDTSVKLNQEDANSKEELDRRFIELIKLSGTQIQDARDVLPLNSTTLMNVWVSLRSLLNLAKQRWKEEYWVEVFEELKKELIKRLPESDSTVIVRWINENQAKAPVPNKTYAKNISVSESPIGTKTSFTLKSDLGSCKSLQTLAKEENVSVMDFIRNEWKTGWYYLENHWFDFVADNVPTSLSHQLIRHRFWSMFKIPDISLNQPIDKPLKYYVPEERDVADFRGWIITKKHRTIMEQIVKKAQDARLALVNSGIPIEDASHILPIMSVNKFKVSWSLKTLMMLAAERINMQAIYLWQAVMKDIKQGIQNSNPTQGSKEVWNMLLPGWVLWGRNPFQATFDRKEKYKPEEIFNLWEAYSRKNYLLFKKEFGSIFFDELTEQEAEELEGISNVGCKPLIDVNPFYEKMIEEEKNLINMWFNGEEVSRKMKEKYSEENLKDLEFYDQLKNTITNC